MWAQGGRVGQHLAHTCSDVASTGGVPLPPTAEQPAPATPHRCGGDKATTNTNLISLIRRVPCAAGRSLSIEMVSAPAEATP